MLTKSDIVHIQQKIENHLCVSRQNNPIYVLFANKALGQKYIKECKMLALLTHDSTTITVCDLLLKLSKRQRKQIKWRY